MKTNLFLPNKPQPVVDWEQFKALSTAQQVPKLDVAAINARLAPGHNNPYRYLRGTFRVPEDASVAVIRKVAGQKIKQFIKDKENQGWKLAGRPEVYPSRFGRTIELDGSGGQQGMQECVVRAVFQKLDFRPVRLDVSE